MYFLDLDIGAFLLLLFGSGFTTIWQRRRLFLLRRRNTFFRDLAGIRTRVCALLAAWDRLTGSYFTFRKVQIHKLAALSDFLPQSLHHSGSDHCTRKRISHCGLHTVTIFLPDSTLHMAVKTAVSPAITFTARSRYEAVRRINCFRQSIRGYHFFRLPDQVLCTDRKCRG